MGNRVLEFELPVQQTQGLRQGMRSARFEAWVQMKTKKRQFAVEKNLHRRFASATRCAVWTPRIPRRSDYASVGRGRRKNRPVEADENFKLRRKRSARSFPARATSAMRKRQRNWSSRNSIYFHSARSRTYSPRASPYEFPVMFTAVKVSPQPRSAGPWLACQSCATFGSETEFVSVVD